MDLPIGRDLYRRTRMAAYERKPGTSLRGHLLGGNAREARTDWRALAQVDGTTFVEVQLHTGRTHQIRVHFSAIKHPVVGDVLYGAAPQLCPEPKSPRGKSWERDRSLLPPLGRNFLHAAWLGFSQPRTGDWMEVRAPLPPELRAFLHSLVSAANEDSKRIDAVLAPYL